MKLDAITFLSSYRHLGFFKFTLMLALILTAGIYIGRAMVDAELIEQQQQKAQVERNLEQIYTDYNRLEQKFNILNVELEVEKQASRSSQHYLQQAQDEEYALRRQLTFYQKIMAPEIEGKGVIIEELELIPSQSHNHYRFKLTLVQLKQHKQAAKGNVNIHLHGSKNQRHAKLDLIELAAVDDKASFNFKYFDIIEGSFELPQDFLPEQVIVEINIPKSKWRKKSSHIEQSFPWLDTPILAKQNANLD